MAAGIVPVAPCERQKTSSGKREYRPGGSRQNAMSSRLMMMVAGVLLLLAALTWRIVANVGQATRDLAGATQQLLQESEAPMPAKQGSQSCLTCRRFCPIRTSRA